MEDTLLEEAMVADTESDMVELPLLPSKQLTRPRRHIMPRHDLLYYYYIIIILLLFILLLLTNKTSPQRPLKLPI